MGPQLGTPHTNTVHPVVTKGLVAAWAVVWLHQRGGFARWKEFAARRGMGQCQTILQCSQRGGGEAVLWSKMGRIAGGVS